jgi:hypothetical protein
VNVRYLRSSTSADREACLFSLHWHATGFRSLIKDAITQIHQSASHRPFLFPQDKNSKKYLLFIDQWHVSRSGFFP